MPRISTKPLISEAELEKRRTMNEKPLPYSPNDTYGVIVKDTYFIVKKSKYYPYGSVNGFGSESDVIDKFFLPYIDKTSFFLDVGAAYGQYSLRALTLGAKVLAIEPDPRLVEALTVNSSINNFNSLRIGEFALADASGIMDYDDLVDVPVMTIDNLFSQIIAPPLTFIKIDVEGFESPVIEGGLETIKKYKPKILIENHMLVRNRLPDEEVIESEDPHIVSMTLSIDRTKKIIKTLKEIGYTMEYISALGSTWWTFFRFQDS